MAEDGLQEGGEEVRYQSMTPVFWLTLGTLLLTPVLFDSRAGRAAMEVLVATTAIVALRRSGPAGRTRYVGEALVVLAMVATVGARLVGEEASWLETAAQGVFVLLLMITPATIVVRLLRRPRITVDTVAGALAAYVQMGMFFAMLYRFVELAGDDLFFGQSVSLADFQFFSFVTLTTLGYGNLVPAEDLGQTLAVLEAILGQLFLVTVVALAVGNLGATIPRRDRGTRGASDGSP